MKVRILVVGHLKTGPELTLIKDYLKRFHWRVEVTELSAKKGLSGSALKEAEGELILGQIPSGGFLIALDERGESPSSVDFSHLIADCQNQGISQIFFCIGGADGLSERVKKRASRMISFGKMTWPHMLVRVMLVEQLYRAQQILSGHPYHRV